MQVVLDGGLANARVGGGHRAELVGDRSVARRRRVVLERVRVDRVEAEPERLGVLAQRRDVVRLVPGHVEAHRAVRAGERVQRRDVVELLLDRPRLAAAGEAAEARAARAERPRRGGDAEAREPLRSRSRRPTPCSSSSDVAAASPCSWRSRSVRLERRDRLWVQLHCGTSRAQRGKAAGMPPSTGMNVPVVTLRSPPTSAATAAAMCSGRISVFSSVRSA